MSTLHCKFCGYSNTSLHTFIRHARSHRNVANYWYACGVPQCACTFKKYPSFKSHMYRHHHSRIKTQARVQPQDTITTCQVEGCTFQATDFSSLCSHLRWHLGDGKKVNCPHIGCTKYFRVKSSFSSHLSRYHKTTPCETGIQATPASQEHEQLLPLSDDMGIDLDTVHVEDAMFSDQTAFLNSLALFYLKMQAKLLIPASTVQNIIEEYQEVHNSGTRCLMSKLREKLFQLNLLDSDVNEILSDIAETDLFKTCHDGPLRSDQTRKQFFKKTFSYVEPSDLLGPR